MPQSTIDIIWGVRKEMCILRLSPNTKLHQGARDRRRESELSLPTIIVEEWECRIQGEIGIKPKSTLSNIELFADRLYLMDN